MSKLVDDLIKDMEDYPPSFKAVTGIPPGLIKGNISTLGMGNTRVLSVINLEINNKNFPLTYFDRWKLEVAHIKWYKNCSLEHVSEE